MKELKNPIIFIGTGRSGTTIISETIMIHIECFNYFLKFI